MTYAEAVKRAVGAWLSLYEVHGFATDTDSEALAVLRRAGKVMEAAERMGPGERLAIVSGSVVAGNQVIELFIELPGEKGEKEK